MDIRTFPAVCSFIMAFWKVNESWWSSWAGTHRVAHCSLKSFTRKRDSSLVLQLIPLLLVTRSYIQSRSDQSVGRMKQVARDRHSTVLPVDVFEMEKTSFNPFPGKAMIESRRNFENFGVVYLWRHALIILVVKMC